VVTKSKDLRTGCSIWEQRRAINVPHRPLTRDIETDVLVVGAGITGALIADALAMSELKVTVVDKRGPAKGSTNARTALVLLCRLLPKLDASVMWAWIGTFGQTDTGLPIIGKIRTLPNFWVALGYGGNGITYAQIASDIIAGALTGCPDVDADLYDFPELA
jgi:glycine/D-amino acid oxidase-like deaminating enzyme